MSAALLALSALRAAEKSLPNNALQSTCKECVLDTEGRIDRYREDFVDGLENAPEAFIGMLEGRNFGKLIVRVGA
jgi:NADPH-dependent curcumin reductase CurA